MDIGIILSLGQFSEDELEPCKRLDTAGAAGQQQAIDDSAGFGSINRVAEQPTLSSRGEDSDVALQKVVVDGHPAVFSITRQIFPLVERVGDGITEFGIGQDFGCDCVEPLLETVENRDAMFLPEAANAVCLCFIVTRIFVSRLPFYPVKLVEELQGLFRRAAGLFPCVERSKKRRRA